VNGTPVLPRDQGEFRDAGQIQTNIVRINGARQVYLPIYRQPGTNTIKVRLGRHLCRLKGMNSAGPRMRNLALPEVMEQWIGVLENVVPGGVFEGEVTW